MSPNTQAPAARMTAERLEDRTQPSNACLQCGSPLQTANDGPYRGLMYCIDFCDQFGSGPSADPLARLRANLDKAEEWAIASAMTPQHELSLRETFTNVFDAFVAVVRELDAVTKERAACRDALLRVSARGENVRVELPEAPSITSAENTMVRAKFRVDTKDPGESGNVTLTPVYSADPNHENKAFWDATPSGSISMRINNPRGFAGFELGKEYYVDFTPAE